MNLDNQLQSLKQKVDIPGYVPTKSIRTRPSQTRPAGEWKKVSPLGGGVAGSPNIAVKAPVSELESPKLNMAGKLHSGKDNIETGSNNVTYISSLLIGFISSMSLMEINICGLES